MRTLESDKGGMMGIESLFEASPVARSLFLR